MAEILHHPIIYMVLAPSQVVIAGFLNHQQYEVNLQRPRRWALTIYMELFSPYKWPYQWVTGIRTLLIGVITPFITGSGAHLIA